MARAKAQREAVQPKNTEQLTPDQLQEVAAIEARRQQAGVTQSSATTIEAKTE